MTEPKPIYAVPGAGHRLGPYMATVNCRVCHSILASVIEWDKRTAVILYNAEDHPVLAFVARFHCECGREQSFRSELMSAIRLGIAEE